MGFRSNIFDVKSITCAPKERKDTFKKYDKAERHLPGTHEFAYSIWKLLVKALGEIKDRAFQNHISKLDADIDQPDEKRGASKEVNKAPELIWLFARMLHSDVQELAPRFTPEAHLLLSVDSPQVIHTNLGMTTKFFSILEDPRWDLLLSVSEMGKAIQHAGDYFKRKRAAHLPRRRASLVVTDPLNLDRVEDRLREYDAKGWLIGDNYILPYWAHNDHMLITLRMSMEEGVFEPLAAISYQRRGLENRINPVYIEHPDDLEILLQIYFAYIVKAEGYRKGTKKGKPEQGAVPTVNQQAAQTQKKDADEESEQGAVPTVNQQAAQTRKKELEKEWWTDMRLYRDGVDLTVAPAGE